MQATIIKFLSDDKQVRILVLDNTAIIQKMLERQPLKAAYAEALAACFSLSSILCGTLKDRQRLSIRLKTSTPYEWLHCDIQSNGDVRGYASDAIAANNRDAADLSSVIGAKGMIRMTKDIGMGTVFTSTVDMPYRNIADDFAHFFKQSEQIDTVFRYFYLQQSSSVIYSRAALIQELPFASSGALERRTTELDKQEELFRTAGQDFTAKITTAFCSMSIIEQHTVRLFCPCSKEALMPLLYALGAAELEEIFAGKHTVEIACSLCGNKYVYSQQDMVQRSWAASEGEYS